VFFTWILPPIIFAAGYNIRRKAFFKYFLYIILYGVLGTVITFIVVTPLTYFANSYNLFHFTFYNPEVLSDQEISHNTALNESAVDIVNETVRILSQVVTSGMNRTDLRHENNILSNSTNTSEDPSGSQLIFSLKEILLFASVISATDTVAALTFVKEETDPKLFSILFGEGVVNDAVCIVLYKILLDFTNSGEGINLCYIKFLNNISNFRIFFKNSVENGWILYKFILLLIYSRNLSRNVKCLVP